MIETIMEIIKLVAGICLLLLELAVAFMLTVLIAAIIASML